MQFVQYAEQDAMQMRMHDATMNQVNSFQTSLLHHNIWGTSQILQRLIWRSGIVENRYFEFAK